MSCLFAQKKKSECNREKKKIYRGALLFIHREKNITLSLLATLLAVIKCRVKAPEGRMGLLRFSKKCSPSV